jgi:hypothetical protein
MKLKLFFVLSLLILSTVGLTFYSFRVTNLKENEKLNSQSTPPPTPQNNRWISEGKYFIGGINCINDCNTSYNNLDWLGFKLWHNYTGALFNNLTQKYEPYVAWNIQGWNCAGIGNDSLRTNVDRYSGAVKDKIDGICRNTPDRKLLMSRPKIDWLCYGQRSDYRCVELSHLDQNLWFYGFQSLGNVGADVQDNVDNVPRYVRYCQKTDPQTDGMVVSRLKANTEQSRSNPNGNYGNVWMGDSQSDWIIKPRIKVPLNFPITNSETPVCRITVISQNGSTILKEVVITGKYFGNSQNPYDGKYKEDGFYFPNDTDLTILNQAWGNKYIHSARGNRTLSEELADTNINRADIQVYWYGNCDMWIDYVRVDNDVASDLFSIDTGNIVHQRYIKWINDEVIQVGLYPSSSNPAVMKYYLEYVEFNNLPCIRYVNDKLIQYTGGKIDIMQDFCNTISWHVPVDNRPAIQDANFLSPYYVNRAGYSQIFAECYPFIACYGSNTQSQEFSKLPCTLFPDCNQNYDSVLGKPVPTEEYESWLQNQLFHSPSLLEGGSGGVSCNSNRNQVSHPGYFRYIMQTCNAISRLSNVPFIFMPQVHQNYEPSEVEREPTNQELDMIANIAVSYGAKGLLYFSYNSWHNQNDGSYARGIAEENNSLRTENFYHQTNPDKKTTMQNITERVSNKWGGILLSFDNTKINSYNFHFEGLKLRQETYILDAATSKPATGLYPCMLDDPQPPGPGYYLKYDCPEFRYLQIATFENPNETYPNYLMVVNERCSPLNTDPENTGLRFIRLTFKANSFPGLPNNLCLQNVITNETIGFNNNTANYVNLSDPVNYNSTWFNPGEGRLYHILPITETGGTLAGDEYINTSVTIKKNIYSGVYVFKTFWTTIG